MWRDWVQFCSDAHSWENVLFKTSETVTGDVRNDTNAEHFMHHSAVVPHSRHVSLWQAFVPRVLTHTYMLGDHFLLSAADRRDLNWKIRFCSASDGVKSLVMSVVHRKWGDGGWSAYDWCDESCEFLREAVTRNERRSTDEDEKMFEMNPDQLRCFYDAEILKSFPFDG